MSNQPSPYDVAMNPPEQKSGWFGQMTVNAWFCAWVPDPTNADKKMKINWDPNSKDSNGKPLRRNTSIDLKLEPITEQPSTAFERSVMAEYGEWVKFILPSLKDIGVTSLEALHGAWVQIEFASTGETYIDKRSGEAKDSKTWKFVAIYPDEATCRAAYQEARGESAAAAQATAQTNGNGNGNRERETAEKFLKPYVQKAWQQSGGDLDKARGELATMIAGQVLLAKFFTVDSPEVMDLLAVEATA